jgi:hypothetical protein
MKAHLVAFLAIGLCAGGAVQAQTLWGPTTHGMTRAEVMQAVPQAHAASAGSTNLIVNEVEIVDQKFTVNLGFTADALDRVSLELKEKVRSPDYVFERLVEALRAKYGAEVSRNRMAGFGPVLTEATWSSGRTTIKLSLMQSKDVQRLNIDYTSRLAEDAEKL